MVHTIEEVVAQFGDRVEYRSYASIFQWDIVQKYGVIRPPVVIINEEVRLTKITKDALRRTIEDQLQYTQETT